MHAVLALRFSSDLLACPTEDRMHVELRRRLRICASRSASDKGVMLREMHSSLSSLLGTPFDTPTRDRILMAHAIVEAELARETRHV